MLFSYQDHTVSLLSPEYVHWLSPQTLLFKGAAQLRVQGSDASGGDTARRFVCLQPPEKEQPAIPHRRFVKEARFAAQIITQILTKLVTIVWHF